MAVDVAQPLLRDPVEGQLDRPRQAPDRLVNRQLDRDAAAPGEAVDKPLQRGGQPELVEQGRVQQVRLRAQVAQGLLAQRPRLGQELAPPPIEAGRLRGEAGQEQALGEEVLGGHVVQLARDAPPLLVLDLEEPRAQLPQQRLRALALAEVDHEGDAAVVVAGEDRPAAEDRHPPPVVAQVVLLVRRPGPMLGRLGQRLRVAVAVLRRGALVPPQQPPPRAPPG